MNLPPDKLKLLSQYDNEKKWELVCDQVRVFFFFLTNLASSNRKFLEPAPPLGQSWLRVHKQPEWVCGTEQGALTKPCSSVSVAASDRGVGMATVSGLCLFYLHTQYERQMMNSGASGPLLAKDQQSKATVWLTPLCMFIFPPGAFPGEEPPLHIPDQDQELLPGPGRCDSQGQCEA